MKPLKIKTAIIITIGTIVLMLLGMLWFSLYTVRNISNTLSIQVNTRTTIITLKDILTYCLDAETGERGYAITGDTSYLEPYNAALGNIESTYNKLRQMTAGNNEQQLNLDTLRNFLNKKLAFMKAVVDAKKQGEENYALKLRATGDGKFFMDRIRSLVHKMLESEEKRFSERQAATAKSIAKAKVVFVTEAIFALLITLTLALIVINELNRRNKTEKKLSDINIELTRKNKEIEQFAFIASHDLQEPLRSISNFASLLSPKIESYNDPDAKRYMQTILRGTQRMSALIYDLLEYSRIGNDLNKTQVDCNMLVKEILTDMEAMVKDNHAKVTFTKLPVVNGHAYLKSLFQNLLSNAIKFHKPGTHPEVNVSASENGKEYIFKIRDNGIGIENKFNDRIFIIFQRLHTRSEYPGTGIGLAQCQKIVELHGGKIWVESEPGKGSIFYFTIPKSK